MTDRTCARNCMKKGSHYATCAWYGMPADGIPERLHGVEQCSGCAPRDAFEGSMLCGACFGRARQARQMWRNT